MKIIQAQEIIVITKQLTANNKNGNIGYRIFIVRVDNAQLRELGTATKVSKSIFESRESLAVESMSRKLLIRCNARKRMAHKQDGLDRISWDF